MLKRQFVNTKNSSVIMIKTIFQLNYDELVESIFKALNQIIEVRSIQMYNNKFPH